MNYDYSNNYDRARRAYLEQYDKGRGIAPSDGRRPFTKTAAQDFVAELNDLPRDSHIGIVDCWFQLCISLKEAGFTNLSLIERTEQSGQYYDTISIISN